jgi:hypothetical protein
MFDLLIFQLIVVPSRFEMVAADASAALEQLRRVCV